LLGWSREDLAAKSGTGAETVKNFEFRGSDPKLGTVQKWRRALEAAGVQFIDADETGGPGLRLRLGKKR
jgi:transcriptional regulator with XRE-family HTH domain